MHRSVRPLASLVLIAVVVAPCTVRAEDDGDEFFALMQKPKAREQVMRYIDAAADKWEGRGPICTPETDRANARFQAVYDWLEAHPDERWRPQRYVIVQGLRARYPCPASGAAAGPADR
ncbi:MAG: hypothetical protein MUF30_07070 [Burkholderiales bacterium]|jgi:hypothetical protein|nr:hypothetical protein [Burkholderiales bacterium]